MKTKICVNGKKRLFVGLIAVLAVVALGAACFFGNMYRSGNFHTVVPGGLYRSAQLDAAQIEALQKQYGFKTIINLRGKKKGTPWYDAEVAAAQKLGLTHIDFGMSAVHELSHEDSVHLIETLKTVEKPILIHCKAGADRTGLASAFYLAAVEKRPEREAESQLSIAYGHFSLPFLGEFNMDRTFDKLEPYLGYPAD